MQSIISKTGAECIDILIKIFAREVSGLMDNESRYNTLMAILEVKMKL